MVPNIVMRAVRANTRSFLIFAIILFGLTIGGTLLGLRYLTNFFAGPRTIQNAELEKITNSESINRYWVNVKGSDALDTGWQKYTEENGTKTITKSYVALAIGTHYLLVQVPHAVNENSLETSYTGALTKIPSDVESQVIADMRNQSPDVADALLPLMLDTSDFRTDGYLGIAAIIIGTLLGLWCLVIFLRRTANPNRTPILKTLSRYGDTTVISENISQELVAPHTVYGRIHITPHWLVYHRAGTFQAARLQDVVWLYAKIVQHRTNGIPTGKTYEGHVWDKYGALTVFHGSQKQVDAGLQAVFGSASWAIAGFNKDFEKKWKSSRDSFIHAVNVRRTGVAALP